MIARATDLRSRAERSENTGVASPFRTRPVRGPENDWEFYFVKGDAPTMSYADDDEALRWDADRTPDLETIPSAKSTCC